MRNEGGGKPLRIFLYLILGAVAVVAALFSAAAIWTWSAQPDEPRPVDAVVVLAYGQDRIDKGVELVEEGVADTLVLSVSKRMDSMLNKGNMVSLSPYALESEPLPTKRWMPECGANFGSFDTICFFPAPHSTVGEALAVKELAEQNGWGAVLIATEPSHLNRARATFEECSGVTVYAVSSDRGDGWWRTTWRTVYEAGALAKHLVRPSCT